jgi:hypothetical protein
MFTRARQLSLSWARWIQFVPPHSISLRSILILSRIIMDSGFDDWVYCNFFTITVDYNSSHIELLLTNLSEGSLNLSLLRIGFSQMHKSLPFYQPRGPNISHQVEQLIVLCCRVGCHENLVFSSLLPGNDPFVAIYCNGNVISDPLLSNGRLMQLHHSDFQPSCHNIILPFTFRSSESFLFFWLTHQNSVCIPRLSHESCMLCLSHAP